jgi:methionyl-tRNA formyltransferase
MTITKTEPRRPVVVLFTKGPWLGYPYVVASALKKTVDCEVVVLAESLTIRRGRFSSTIARGRALAASLLMRGQRRDLDPGIKPDSVIEIGSSLNSRRAIDVVRDLNPDYGVNTWGVLYRRSLIEAVNGRLLNAHMGLLPYFRGVNAAEWSVYRGAPTGVTVHFIDAGIDTGDILETVPVPVVDYRSIDAMRAELERVMPRALAKAMVAHHSGRLIAAPQRPEDGRQFFQMHASLRNIIANKLRLGYRPSMSSPNELLTTNVGALSGTAITDRIA